MVSPIKSVASESFTPPQDHVTPPTLMDPILLHPELHYGSRGWAVMDQVRPRSRIDAINLCHRAPDLLLHDCHCTAAASYSVAHVWRPPSRSRSVFTHFLLRAPKIPDKHHLIILEIISFIAMVQIRTRSVIKCSFVRSQRHNKEPVTDSTSN